MKNKKPIILNCFSRGGSNILWNFFLSHPNVCHPKKETIQIFNASIKNPTLAGLKIAMQEKRILFNQWSLVERNIVGHKTKKYIDSVLYKLKLENYHDQYMKYKAPNLLYTKDELKNTRLVLKNNNGLTFCSKLFNDIYPDAYFIALIRNPIALFESHKRRRTPVSKSINTFSNFYQKMVFKMESDKKILKRYKIIKFEDLILNPNGSIDKLYELTGLSSKHLKKIRLKEKSYTGKHGNYLIPSKNNSHRWYDLNSLTSVLDPKVNENQLINLKNYEKEQLYKVLETIMKRYGYEI